MKFHVKLLKKLKDEYLVSIPLSLEAELGSSIEEQRGFVFLRSASGLQN